MQDDHLTEQPPSLQEQLFDIVNRMLAPYGKAVSMPDSRNALAYAQYPFDIHRPSQHDTKAEFQRERKAVLTSIEAAEKVFEALVPRSEDKATTKTRDKLRQVINSKAKSRFYENDLGDSTNLIRKNVADVGAYGVTLMIFLDLKNVLTDRLEELEQQKDRFWNLPHRAPDYHARAIALRLARVFAKETGQRPTYGLSGETGEPSTSYSRALKEVFVALGISSQERGYAEWAVGHITEKDINPVRNALLSSALALGDGPVSESIAEALRRNELSEPPKK